MHSPSSDRCLQSVNLQLNRAWQWRPVIAQGTSNRLYRNNSATEPRLLRINAAAQTAFGVCRQREAGVLDYIAEFAWSPDIVVNRPEAGWCLMHDYGERRAQHCALLTAEQLPAIITQMQTLSAAQDLQIDIGTLWQCYEQRINSIVDTQRGSRLRRKLQRLRQAYASLPKVPSCLSHQDLHPGNLITNGNQLIVLDWEYAGFTPPWLDAAALAAEFNIATEVIHQLPAFCRLTDTVFETALMDASRVRTLLCELWFDCRSNDSKIG